MSTNELSQGQIPKVSHLQKLFYVVIAGLAIYGLYSYIKPSEAITYTFAQPITIHSAEELESLAAYFEYHQAFADSPFYELYGHKDTLSNTALRLYGQARLDSFFSELGYDSKDDSFGSKILYIKNMNHE